MSAAEVHAEKEGTASQLPADHAEKPQRGTRFNEVVEAQEPAPQAEPQAEPQTEPSAKPQAEPQADPQAEPQAKPQTEPNAKPQAETHAKPHSKLKSAPQAQPQAQSEQLNADDDAEVTDNQMSAVLRLADAADMTIVKHVLDIDEEKLWEALELESDSSSVHSVPSYVMQKELESTPDFFEELGEIPRISEVSLEAAELLSRISAASLRKSTGEMKDVGRFVDPLTGALEEEPQPEPEPEPEPVEEEEDEEEEEEEEDEIPEDDELLCVLEVEEEKEIVKELDQADAFETFLEMETEREVRIEEWVDMDALEREEVLRQLFNITTEFIAELIGHVVDACEYVDPTTLLRTHLDKSALMYEIELKLIELELERKTRTFLNRKTVDHFRRKKAFRSIVEDPPDHVAAEMQKYQAATTNLDRLLGREEEVKTTTQLKTQRLEAEASAMELRAKDEISVFEDLVRTTLGREAFERLQMVINLQLGNMNVLREEISSVRFILIERQHSLALLAEKLEKLENLGNGLHMREFETLQTETQALDKKIEERNADLNKLRFRYNADLHLMSHIKEKQTMMRNTLSIKKKALALLTAEKQACRELLYDLKLDRGRLRRETRELSFQGGLIDKPALMLDYDETVEKHGCGWHANPQLDLGLLDNEDFDNEKRDSQLKRTRISNTSIQSLALVGTKPA